MSFQSADPSCATRCLSAQPTGPAVCDQHTTESACATAAPSCLWKSPCATGSCVPPPTDTPVYMVVDEQDSTAFRLTTEEQSTPLDKTTRVYTGCHAATPATCRDAPSGTRRPEDDDDASATDPTFGEGTQQNCQGCLMYQKSQTCGTTFQQKDGKLQSVHDPERRPCLCDPDDPCCGDDEGWLVGADGTCHQPTEVDAPGGLRERCENKPACVWSSLQHRCMGKACVDRTNSKTCNQGMHGQRTGDSVKDNLYACAWVGEIGGSGTCIDVDCHNRCNKEDCTKMVDCLLYTSPSPRDLSTSRMPSSA